MHEGWERLKRDLGADELPVERVKGALSILTDRQRQYIDLRYGLTDGEFKTIRAIAAKLGITKSAPGSSLRQARWRLRNELGTNELSRR